MSIAGLHAGRPFRLTILRCSSSPRERRLVAHSPMPPSVPTACRHGSYARWPLAGGGALERGLIRTSNVGTSRRSAPANVSPAFAVSLEDNRTSPGRGENDANAAGVRHADQAEPRRTAHAAGGGANTTGLTRRGRSVHFECVSATPTRAYIVSWLPSMRAEC
jgi:hypothetical protein